MPEGGRTKHEFRTGPTRRVGNAMITPLIRAGLVPHTYLLTTRGRRTGRSHTNPVTLVEHGEQRWLVAPYGTVDWVRNARAAGRVSLRRGRRKLEHPLHHLQQRRRRIFHSGRHGHDRQRRRDE